MKSKSFVPALPETRKPGSRRKFLKAATGVAAGGATLGFPMIAKGQTGPIKMRWQSTWPSKDIFHEFALDYAKKVNDMTGGDLKIEVLPAGAVVPAFGLLDAVSKGTLDGGHGVLVYHYGKQNALALWGSGPAFGMDGNTLLSWHKYGGGKELLNKLYASIGANVVSFPYGPHPTQPLGWFKKPITKVDDFKGMKYRTVGISIDLFTGMGAAVNALPGGEIVPAMDRGLLDAAEFNNASSDRLLGFPDVSKVCMLQSFHQNAEQFEITFNKTKFDALPEKMKAIIALRRGRRVRRHDVEGDRPLLEGLRRVADEGQRQVLQDTGCDPAEAARDLRLGHGQEEGQRALRRDHRVAEGVRRACRALGPGHLREPAHGVQLLFRAKPRRLRRRRNGGVVRECPAIRCEPGGCFLVCAGRAASVPWLLPDRPSRVRIAMQKLLLFVDKVSTFVGQTFSWLIVTLTLLITWEVYSRYVLDHPHAWAFDVMIMMYGTLFMMAGAYTLAKNSHVRGDVLYGFFPPRLQAGLDLALYFLFFLPGIIAFVWAGYTYAGESWAINEHSNITSEGPPVYPFKTVIPVAGALILIQGIVEIIRCIICLKRGEWPSRAEDVQEVDVDKLKEMVHVKDEDIAKLDKYVVEQQHGEARK